MEEYLKNPKRKSSRIDIHYYIGSQRVNPDAMYHHIEYKKERAIVHHHIHGERCNNYCEEIDCSEE